MRLLAIIPPKIKGEYWQREDKVSVSRIYKVNPYTFPTALALIRQQIGGISIKAIDAQVEDMSNSDVEEIAKQWDPDIIISFMSAFGIPWDRRTAEMPYHTIGVITPSTTPIREAIQLYDLKTEYFTKSEVPFTLVNALKEFREKGRIEDTKGLMINREGTIIDTGPSVFYPLKGIPLPAFDLLPFEKYWEVVHINTSSGCPFSCTYCCEALTAFRKTQGVRIRYKRLEDVITEIKFILSKYNRRRYFFMDNEFGINVRRAKELCRRMIEEDLNISWACMDRVELIDDELARLMRDAGCEEVGLGLETADEKVQRMIKKNLKMAKVVESAMRLKRQGIRIHIFLMIGLPGENKESISKTIKLMRKIQPDTIGTFVCYPTPGGELYYSLKSQGRLLENDWSKYKTQDRLIFKHEFYKDIFEMYEQRERIFRALTKMNMVSEILQKQSGLSKVKGLFLLSLIGKQPFKYLNRWGKSYEVTNRILTKLTKEVDMLKSSSPF